MNGDPQTFEVPMTPICDKSKIEVLHMSNEGSGWLNAVPLDTALRIEREKAFYRDLLEQVASDTKKTKARRLAESGLTFWDSLLEKQRL